MVVQDNRLNFIQIQLKMYAKDNKIYYLTSWPKSSKTLFKETCITRFCQSFHGGSLANCVTKLQKVIEYNIVFQNFSSIHCMPAMISVLIENSANSFTLVTAIVSLPLGSFMIKGGMYVLN